MGAQAIRWAADQMVGFEQARVGAITLVRPRRTIDSPRSVMLHVHGYNDYFFQSHLADAITGAGHAFYAVDLPFAGRSLMPGDTPHFMSDAGDQADSIGLAVDAVASLHPSLPIVVHGHSTGGLTAAIWAADQPHARLAGLILDSPLFGLPFTRWQRVLLLGLPALAACLPMAVVSSVPSVYAGRQHVTGGGRWQFDRTLKRPAGVPVRAAWLAATQRARARIARGVTIRVPVWVAVSDSSGPDTPNNPLLDQQDTVVSVAQIRRLAPRLGDRVQVLVIPGAVHDLSLSQDAPRARYLKAVTGWLDSVSS